MAVSSICGSSSPVPGLKADRPRGEPDLRAEIEHLRAPNGNQQFREALAPALGNRQATTLPGSARDTPKKKAQAIIGHR
jgi:hypothetical protein